MGLYIYVREENIRKFSTNPDLFLNLILRISLKQKNPSEEGFSLIWQRPTFPGFTQVSSARGGLTSLFEKGRGEHP